MQHPFTGSTWSVYTALGYAFDNGPSADGHFSKNHVVGAGQFGSVQLPAELSNRILDRWDSVEAYRRRNAPNSLN